MTPRAKPLPPDERRTAIIEAAIPVILEHGRATSTKQIAAAAGVAEGTLFRVFETKEELFAAALESAFDSAGWLAEVGALDLTRPLRERLIELTTLLQQRFVRIFTLMTALAQPGPPPGRDKPEVVEHLTQMRAAMVALVAEDADAFRVPPAQVIKTLRLLTFSGSHPHISDHEPLTPDEIVDVVLTGTLRPAPTQAKDA